MKKVLFILVLGIALMMPLFAEGQSEKPYPSKTIEIIVPSGAGGSTDGMARIFAKVAEKHLPGANFAIVNKPGSGGQQGFEAIASAKPDGYTLGTVFTVQLPSHVVSKRARYTLDDFHFLSKITDDSSIIVVPKDSPVSDLEGLIEYAKNNSMTASVNGIGSDDHLALMLFQNATGTEFQVIPASGSTEQKANVMGGHVDVAFMNFSQMQTQHVAGDAKILAILAAKRKEALPDIPTTVELGYNVKMSGTRGFVIQKDVPDDIKQTLEKLMDDVVNDPEFAQTLTDSQQSFSYMSGPDYAAFMDELKSDMEVIFEKEPW